MSDPTPDLDFLAYWWLPENPERRIPGRLRWDPDSGGDLQLMGELRQPRILDNHLPGGGVQKYRPRSEKRDRQHPVIHGSHINRFGDEEAYTLLNSISLSIPHGLTERPEHITAGAVLHGAWYTDPADIEADRAIFAIRHLSSWVNTTGVETESPELYGAEKPPFAIITARRLPFFLSSHEDMEVRLQQSLTVLGDHDHVNGVEETWQLEISSSSMGELGRFTDIATDIRALVTIAAGKTADIERASLQHPKLHMSRLDGTPVPGLREDITYLNRWAHRGTDTASVRAHELYFDFQTFGGPDGLQRWLQTARTYHTEIRRVMATRYTDTMYLEDRIMNVCAALERFDTVRRDKQAPKVLRNGKLADPSFVDRIEACVDFAGPEFKQLIVEPSETWSKRVRDARNQLAHHDDPFRASGQVGEHVLAEQTYWLFVLCVLRVCDAPEDSQTSQDPLACRTGRGTRTHGPKFVAASRVLNYAGSSPSWDERAVEVREGFSSGTGAGSRSFGAAGDHAFMCCTTSP